MEITLRTNPTQPTTESVETLVTQICYRVSDLSCLLQNDNEDLGDYCNNLRG